MVCRVVLAFLVFGLVACGDDGTGDDFPTLELYITGDASFQGPHAGQVLTDAIIRTTDGAFDLLGGGGGPIHAPPETISFGFGSTVEFGDTYEIHLWIDSNFGGGTVGVCDPPAIDHQWKVPVPYVTGDVNIVVSHDDATVTDVCSTFSSTSCGLCDR